MNTQRRPRSLLARLFGKHDKTLSTQTAFTHAHNPATHPLHEQQEQAARALKQLESTRSDISAKKRQAAWRALAQARTQLEAVRQIGAGDVTTTTRHVARIARDLNAATREFHLAIINQHNVPDLYDFIDQVHLQAKELEILHHDLSTLMGPMALHSLDLREIAHNLREHDCELLQLKNIHFQINPHQNDLDRDHP